VLRGRSVVVVCDLATSDVAERVANLATASEPEAEVRVARERPEPGSAAVLELAGSAPAGVKVVAAGNDRAAFVTDVAAAVAGGATSGRWVVVIAEGAADDDHAAQALAASLLDSLCLGLGGS
jgi:hypothetical protein